MLFKAPWSTEHHCRGFRRWEEKEPSPSHDRARAIDGVSHTWLEKSWRPVCPNLGHKLQVKPLSCS